MLRVEHLRKTFIPPDGSPAVPVVDIDQFQLESGQQAALLGTSGSGKTTLLHLLAGILAPDSGSVTYTVGGQSTDLAALSEAARDHFRGQHIGYIFQTHHLLSGLTSLENVLMGMSFTGRQPDRAFAQHLLERVGLSHRIDYKPGKMSLGQQQRVAVARALANRPALVLADEPTGSLDSKSAQQTLDLIRSLCTEVKSALLLVTHDLSIANQLPAQLNLAALNRPAGQTAPPPGKTA